MYKEKVPQIDKLKCIICDTAFQTANQRNKHIFDEHQLTYEQYIVKYYFGNNYPQCKCGCGTRMNFIESPFGIWFKEYTQNHFPRKKHSKETKDKIKRRTKEALVAKYGVENIYLTKVLKEKTVQKIKKTKEERYGDSNYNNPDKGVVTRIQLYGDGNYNNPDQIIRTNQERYGANSYTASDKCKGELEKKNMEKYGVRYSIQSTEIKDKIKKTNVDRYGYESVFSDPNYRKKYNVNKSKIELEVCHQLNGERHFVYGDKEFDIKVGNNLYEIDGDFWHPVTLERLTISQINSVINDSEKIKMIKTSPYTLFKIHTSKIIGEVNEQILQSYAYLPDYSLAYKQHIIEKSYFKNFLAKKGKQKLEKYIPLLLKFVRTFQPQFPYPDLEENIDDIINKIHKYDVSKLKIDSGFNNNSSHIGSNYLKHYFKSYWNSAFKKQLTPVEVWQNDELMKKIIAYRIGVNNSGEVFDFSWHQLVRGISARRFTISWFKPILAAAIYKQIVEELKLDDSLVTFDPCCGFGARLLAFKSLYPDGTYIGCEPNIDTYNELSQLINNAKFNNVQIYNCKFEDLIIDFKYDFVFTSIPYYDKEVYSNDINYESIDDWEAQFFNPLMRLQNKYINLPVELYDVLQLDNTIWNKIQSNTSHYNQNASSKQELIIK